VRLTAETPLVLGSASPRRRELLALAGVPIVVRTAAVDESPRPAESPSAYLERIALAKLAAICASELPATPGVLVADTIVVAPGGAILGKPADPEEARAMLEALSGATHEVRTRFLLGAPRAGSAPVHAQTVTTRVTFRALSYGEMAAYVAGGEGEDKAGAYAVQGGAAAFVERIDGSYTNVVGLPLSEVIVALRGRGWL
jgi:septum formation protein